MGRPTIHVLSDLNPNTKGAWCVQCKRRVRFYQKGKQIWCSQQPERSRKQHYMTQIDPEKRTAVCSSCGPTTISWYTKPTSRWVCQGNKSPYTYAHYEHSSNVERDRMLREHGPLCDICGEEAAGNRSYGKLHYDHDHTTGKFRGWLCARCNKGLGLFRDSPELLQSAMNYLKNIPKM